MTRSDPIPHTTTVWPWKIRLHGRSPGFALVDEADYNALSQFRWRVGSRGYVMRNYQIGHGRKGRKVCVALMHRDLLGLLRGDKRQGDHINGDPLDNRRANLRLATAAQQRQNIHPPTRGSSSHRGVGWHKQTGRWRAMIGLDGRQYHLGYFDAEEEAAAVALAARRARMPYATN